jgi:hypothetical protein
MRWKMTILSEYESKLIDDISNITKTDYEQMKIGKNHFIRSENILVALDDLKQEYDHLLELYEELKNGEE